MGKKSDYMHVIQYNLCKCHWQKILLCQSVVWTQTVLPSVLAAWRLLISTTCRPGGFFLSLGGCIHSQIAFNKCDIKCFFLHSKCLAIINLNYLQAAEAFWGFWVGAYFHLHIAWQQMWDIFFNPKKCIIFMQMVAGKGHRRLKLILSEDWKKNVKAVINHPFWNCI